MRRLLLRGRVSWGRDRNRCGHLHAGLGGVALVDGLGVALSDLNLVILLDNSTARAPVRHTTIVTAAALDVVALSDLPALEHRVAVSWVN